MGVVLATISVCLKVAEMCPDIGEIVVSLVWKKYLLQGVWDSPCFESVVAFGGLWRWRGLP